MNHIASIITYGLAPGNQDFPGGHPFQDASGSSTLNYGVFPTIKPTYLTTPFAKT